MLMSMMGLGICVDLGCMKGILEDLEVKVEVVLV